MPKKHLVHLLVIFSFLTCTALLAQEEEPPTDVVTPDVWLDDEPFPWARLFTATLGSQSIDWPQVLELVEAPAELTDFRLTVDGEPVDGVPAHGQLDEDGLSIYGLVPWVEDSRVAWQVCAQVLGEIELCFSSSVPPNAYLVYLREGPESVLSRAQTLLLRHGGRLRQTYSHLLPAFAATLPAAALEGLGAEPGVLSIDEVAGVELRIDQQNPPWGLDRIDEPSLPMDDRFRTGLSGSGVHIYVVDSGIRASHDEFTGRIGVGRDLVENDAAAQDCDKHGHGTWVASIAAGTEYGVAKDATVHALRVFDCDGGSDTSFVLAAFDFIAANLERPAVVNLSFGGDLGLEFAVQALIDDGVTVVGAAGNSEQDACTSEPGSIADVITVGATRKNDHLWDPLGKRGSDTGPCVDLFAPGKWILGAGHKKDDDKLRGSGTSIATPFVTGAAALYLEARPQATPAEVADHLLDAAVDAVVDAPDDTTRRLIQVVDPPPLGSPTASCSATPQTGTGSVTATLSAAASTDDGTIVSYVWDFDDGATGSGVTTQHTFSAHPLNTFRPTIYVPRITVTDDTGLSASATCQIIVYP